MRRFVLMTCHDTIVYMADHGVLVHGYPDGAKANVLFDSAGQLLLPPERKLAKFQPQLSPVGDRGFVAAKFDDKYISAVPGGSFRLQQALNARESFRLFPEDLLLQAQRHDPQPFPRKMQRRTIPRILHQTFASAVPPADFEKNTAILASQNPQWKCIYWSDKAVHDFIYDHFGWDVLKTYLRINPRYGAARADLFRYLCLYAMGGIYLDIKSGCDQPFDEFLLPDDEYVLCQWDRGNGTTGKDWGLWTELEAVPGGEYQQWHIVAAPGHAFLEAVIDTVLQNIVKYHPMLHGVGKLAALRITGPIAYTKAIHPIRDKHHHRLIAAEKSPFVYEKVAGYRQTLGEHYSVQNTPLVL